MRIATVSSTIRTGVLLSFAFLATVPQAISATIFETGFEQPEYTVGQLQGQNGWFNSTVPVVQNAESNGGTQAAAVSALGQSGQFGAAHNVAYNLVANDTQSVTYSVDIMIDHLAGPVNWYGGAVYGDTGFINQVFVIGGTGEVRLAGVSSGVTMTADNWYQLVMTLDFVNGQTTAYLNGVNLGTQAFVNTPNTSLTYLLGAGVSNTSGTDAWIYYDNMSLTSVDNVPEPSTFVLLGVPLLGLGIWSRRRRSC